ncbi:MAG: hypothetical protein ACLS85_00510 [Coprobacillus cateniformis]
MKKLWRLVKLAQADEFIQRFPDKYDTYIEQGGTNVSGAKAKIVYCSCIAKETQNFNFR